MERKIGIITCSNATQDLDCCSVVCFRDLRNRAGIFSEYPEEDDLVVGGVLSCAGCPTRAYPEKILRKVKVLVELGIMDIHLSNCMLVYCPFLGQYKKVIQEAFPEVNLKEGTHLSSLPPEQGREKLRIIFDTKENMNARILKKV